MGRRPLQKLQRFFRELKRRNVYRVAATYVVVAFVGFQAVKLLIPSTTLPTWADELILAFLIVGFPVSLVVAWAFEMTPEGVRRTPGGSKVEEPETEEGARTAYKLLVGLGLAAAAVAGGWYLTGGGAEAEPRAGDRSIAVLPFEALGQQEPDAFTEGMHDDLLARLSNISELKVISRTSVQQYRDTRKTAGEIARELGVRWVLEGGVQEMGDQIQINAQLIDPHTDTHAWADSYRRDLTTENLFAIQTEITKKITRSLEAEVGPAEAERVERQPTESLKAHRLYAQGRRLMLSRRPDPLRRAIDRFERAIEQDSGYALAWAGLADARILHAHYYTKDSFPPETISDSIAAALPEAELAVRRALKLNPDLAEAHASRAILYMYEQGHLDGRSLRPVAIGHLRRAVELKPSYAQAHQWLGNNLRRIGRPDRGLEHHRLTVELSPNNRSGQNTFVASLFATGRYQEALSEARRLQGVFPGATMYRLQANALVHLKRWSEVRALVTEYRTETDDPPPRWDWKWTWTVYFPALADAAVGDTTAARARIEDLRAMGNEFDAAVVHAALGEVDLAFQRLPEVENWNPRALRYYYPDLLSAFRADPRYEELIRQLNEYEGLNPDGSLPEGVDVSFGSETDE